MSASALPSYLSCPTHSVHLALAQPAMKIKSTLEPTMRSGTHLARPWRAHRAMEKRSCLVWWPRIWTPNTVEPMRTSGTGRDSWDGGTSMTCSYETREVTGAGDWLAQNPEVATAEYAWADVAPVRGFAIA